MGLLGSSWGVRRGKGALLPLAACVAMVAAGAGACSATGDGASGTFSQGGNGPSGSGGAGGAGEGGSIFNSTSSGTGGGNSAGCSDAAKLIYVIGSGNNLYSFYPPTLELTSIGVISCPSGGATPFSMAVDRQGLAWILFSDGRIFHVDTTTAACQATSFEPGQQGLTLFGMGFVSDSAGSEDETLFLGDYNGSGIAAVDTATLTVSPVRPYNAIYSAAELTGTGDARLFGFFQGSPIVIAEIDRNNGAIVSQSPQPSINIGSGWAFAFWGGDFYTFTNPSGSGSQIDRYSPGMGTTNTVLTGIGDNIVGAGVSTCAPTEPPQ